MTNKKLLNTVLTDDGTETGGTSYLGETLKDFLQEIGKPLSSTDNMAKVNGWLIECGILPIKRF